MSDTRKGIFTKFDRKNNNLKNIEEENKKKEQDAKKKTIDSFTGGAESGLCVENPDKPKNDYEGYSQTSNKLNLFLFRNGFKINDGPFRSLEDPANKKFVADVKKGYIPQELVDQGLTDLGIVLQERYIKNFY